MQFAYRTISVVIAGFSVLMFILALSPVTVAATTTNTSTPVIDPLSVQAAMNTEKVNHGRISIAVGAGVPKRISSSPSALADLDLSPSSVLNGQLLEIYARKLMLTTPIEELSIGDTDITMAVTGQARLLGIIPVGLPHTVEVELAGREIGLSVDNTTSWSWLATKPSSEKVIKTIQQRMSQKNYFSSTQLKAHLLKSIIEAITT